MSSAIRTMVSLGDEDELWLSTVSWAIVADRGKMELLPLFAPSLLSLLVSPVSKTTALPLQWGADSVSWCSALRECWTDAKLLPAQEELAHDAKLLLAQEELARDAAGSTSLEHVSQGSVPVHVQPIDPVDSPSSPPFDPGDILPSLRDLEPSDRGRFPAARTYCTHWHCGVEATDDDQMFPPGVCDCCFAYIAQQCALMQ